MGRPRTSGSSATSSPAGDPRRMGDASRLGLHAPGADVFRCPGRVHDMTSPLRGQLDAAGGRTCGSSAVETWGQFADVGLDGDVTSRPSLGCGGPPRACRAASREPLATATSPAGTRRVARRRLALSTETTSTGCSNPQVSVRGSESRNDEPMPSTVSALIRISPACAAEPIRDATCTPWPP